VRPPVRSPAALSGGARGLAALSGVGLAFVARAAATRLSYKTQLSLGLASTAISMAVLLFIGKVVACAGSGFEERYGMSYTAFALAGIVVHGAASAGLGAFRSSVRREQLQGTLEQLLASRGPSAALVAMSGAGDVLASCAGGVALVLACSRFAGLSIGVSAPLVAAVSLYVVTLCGLGLASAGVVLVSKEGEPISWAFGTLSALAGGVYFPVDLLPSWLAPVSRALPTTHVLAVVRASISQDARAVWSPLLFLAVAAVAAAACGVLVLRWGLSRSRRLGTLGEY
jgi:ABC-2 type transport system permease protein